MTKIRFVCVLLGVSLGLSGQAVLAAAVQTSGSTQADSASTGQTGSLRITITSPQISTQDNYVLKGRIKADAAIEHLSYSVNGGPEHNLHIANPFSQPIHLPGRVTRIRLAARDTAGHTASTQVTIVRMEVPPDVAASMSRMQGGVTSQAQMKKLRQVLADSPPPANTSAKSAQAGLAKMKGALADMKKALADAGADVNTPSSEDSRTSSVSASGTVKFPQLPAVPDNSPPVLHILSDSTSTSTRYLLTGTEAKDGGSGRLSYVVNGSQPFELHPKQGYFSTLVTLRRGHNTIKVTATNTAGTTSTRTINVRVSPMPLVNMAALRKHRKPADVRLSAEETARALADPAHAEQGVWSLLANLGIGVYTGKGEQVMPGSETSENDFWLYDFDVPGLARMANQPGGHVGDLSKALTKWGFAIKPDELVTLYRDMFASQKETFTPRLFRIWRIPLGDNPRVTRLQAWLLLISLLPPNGSHSLSGQSDSRNNSYHLASWFSRLLIPNAHAGTPGMQKGKIQGNGASSNFDVAHHYFNDAVGDVQGEVLKHMEKSSKTIEKLVGLNEKISSVAGFIGKVKDAATMVELYSYFVMDMDVSPIAVHMVHDTQYESVGDKKVTITVTIRYEGPKPGSINHGVLSKVKLDLPKTGPLKNAGVRFRFDDFLKKHGYSYDPKWNNRTRMLTDSSGKAVIQYETKRERPREAQKMKTIASGQGKVTAEADLAGAAHQFFNPFASLEILSDFLDMYTMSYPITVSWHVPPQEFELHYTNPAGEIVTIKAYTCDGIHWHGKTTQNATWHDEDGGHSLQSSGKFTVQVQHGSGKGIVPTSGSIKGEYGYKFIDNLRLSLNMAADHKTARVSLRSVLDGRAFPDGYTAPFASFPAVLNRIVTLKQHDCHGK